MSTPTVQRAYNDVVATHYDLDPQGVIGRSLDLGSRQLRKEGLLDADGELYVLDLGMGTGLFLAKLKAIAGDRIVPFGVDLADNMVEYARRRMPDLNVVVGDAAELDSHFPGQQFDCICTHFVTGFVGMSRLAPQIARRLKPGGYWSLIGGTKAAYPALQAKGDSKILRWLTGAGSRKMDDTVLNPGRPAGGRRRRWTPTASTSARARRSSRPSHSRLRRVHGVRLSRRVAHAADRGDGIAQGRPDEALAARPTRLPGRGFAQHRRCPGPQAIGRV